MKPVAASSEARSGARTRSTSDAISVVTSRRSEASVGRSEARIRSRPTVAVGDLQLDRRHVVGVAHQRALVGGAARGDRQHGGRAVDQDQARVERARRERAGSPASPAPSSTASVIAASAARSGVAGPACSCARSANRCSPGPGQNTLGHSTTTTAPTNTPTPTSAARTYTESANATTRSYARRYAETAGTTTSRRNARHAEHAQARGDEVGDRLVAHGCRWNCAGRRRWAKVPARRVTYAPGFRTPPRRAPPSMRQGTGGASADAAAPARSQSILTPEQPGDRRARSGHERRDPRPPATHRRRAHPRSPGTARSRPGARSLTTSVRGSTTPGRDRRRKPIRPHGRERADVPWQPEPVGLRDTHRPPTAGAAAERSRTREARAGRGARPRPRRRSR